MEHYEGGASSTVLELEPSGLIEKTSTIGHVIPEAKDAQPELSDAQYARVFDFCTPRTNNSPHISHYTPECVLRVRMRIENLLRSCFVRTNSHGGIEQYYESQEFLVSF